MWPYWLLFFIPCWFAIFRGQRSLLASLAPYKWSFSWIFIFFLMILMIGLRHEVGADWNNYLRYNIDAQDLPLTLSYLAGGDPAYFFLNWVGANILGGIYFVNTVCGLIFSFGVIRLCRYQRRPWLALTLAIPYLVVVVAMGYTRQGVAIGLGALAIVNLLERKLLIFLLLVTLAATFHKSAIILLPIALTFRAKRPIIQLLGIGVSAVCLFFLFLQESLEALTNEYLFGSYQSSGAFVRVFMNIIPAALFLIFKKRFYLEESAKSLCMFFSILTILAAIFMFISSATTAVDRVALYLIPMQIVICSNIPDMVGMPKTFRLIAIIFLCIYSAAILHIWLLYADNSPAWLPYKIVFWDILF